MDRSPIKFRTAPQSPDIPHTPGRPFPYTVTVEKQPAPLVTELPQPGTWGPLP